jgi:UPF0755 protein
VRDARAGRILLASFVAAVLAGASIVGLAWRDLDEFRSTPYGSDDEKLVEIPRGASLATTIHALSRAGVLSNERLAWRYARYVKRDRRTVKAGQYAFRGALSPDEVLERLYIGAARIFRFTIPEGSRTDEIAAIVERNGAAGAEELLLLMRDDKVAWKLGIPAASLEGFLFPDTYTFIGRPEPRAILQAMVRRYQEEWKRIEPERAPWIELGEVQLVTLASIVEKETGNPSERPRISCVLHNRLRKGMPLQADPTVMYATLLRTGRWSNNITRADLRSPNPYNTYARTGLPPGPIASPGAASLQAAVRPSHCDELYFVARNDGTHAFCRDLECHNAEVHRWQIR